MPHQREREREREREEERGEGRGGGGRTETFFFFSLSLSLSLAPRSAGCKTRSGGLPVRVVVVTLMSARSLRGSDVCLRGITEGEMGG